jgi:2-C-methyl-D-erythritol 2,4-cyclodiphosphate synthase
MLRIGFGFDSHRLEVGREFWLGGIRIPHHKGPTGHSDADALIHAICDALLGAAGLRDIGFYFPDNAIEYKDIDSKILLKKTHSLIKEQSFSIQNIDSTIVLQTPKISPYIPEMIKVLSETLELPANFLAVKAKTSENLGFIGREEGISAYAVVLLAG